MVISSNCIKIYAKLFILYAQITCCPRGLILELSLLGEQKYFLKELSSKFSESILCTEFKSFLNFDSIFLHRLAISIFVLHEISRNS